MQVHGPDLQPAGSSSLGKVSELSCEFGMILAHQAAHMRFFPVLYRSLSLIKVAQRRLKTRHILATHSACRLCHSGCDLNNAMAIVWYPISSNHVGGLGGELNMENVRLTC